MNFIRQDKQVVAYASRALTDVESRYSQAECEALGIVWAACEHFNTDLCGSPNFTVPTDHKPLTSIWQKPKPPLRIERWELRLQPYKMTIKYMPGSENNAYYMSRHPIETHELKTYAEQYVKCIANTSTPHAMNLDDIKMATTL